MKVNYKHLHRALPLLHHVTEITFYCLIVTIVAEWVPHISDSNLGRVVTPGAYQPRHCVVRQLVVVI